jgi:hypothetical protein
MGNQQD